jgi:DNA-binding response OmpR family regulator
MRSLSRCSQAHVIVVSTSASERDQGFVKELGADGYFRKPSEFDEFMKLGGLVKSILARDSN